jgi:hypothetical protein
MLIEDQIVEFITILLANIERENKDGQESERRNLPSLSVATYKDPNQQFINCTLF